MLSNVSITNYALIDRLELDFDKGFNIITGETGAGKSVLLGALGLVLGQRADNDALFDKTRKCIVEARFDLAVKSPVLDFLKEHDFESDDHVIIRREVNPEGRSRSFINDTPASLQQLKEVGALLVDIHSQHETLLLNKSDFQLSVLDALAGNTSLIEDYKRDYRRWQALQSLISGLTDQEQKSIAEQDYLRYQLEELTDASLKAGEQAPLESELEALSNSGLIREKIETVIASLEGDQDNIIQRLAQLSAALQGITKFSPGILTLHDRMKSVSIELKDILT
ncbi:MAG: AAA family ATPase, partial [Bacteroidota bacterium]